jgi:excisionase family DNA binding protein
MQNAAAAASPLSLAFGEPDAGLLGQFLELARLPAVVEQLRRQVDALRADIDRSKTRPSDLMDVNAAAKLLAISPKALRQAVFRGTIRATRVGRRLRFRAEDLLPMAD